MKLVLILISAMVLSACSKSGDSAPAATDPIYGTWYYVAPGASSTSGIGIGGTINADGTAVFLSMKYYSDGVSNAYYYRVSKGTYVRNGDEFKMTYSYETCNPIGQETLNIMMTGEQLLVNIPSLSTQLILNRATDSDQNTAIMIEDKACDKF